MTTISPTTTTARRSPLQLWLEFLASTRSDSRRSTPVDSTTYAAVVQAHRGQAFGGWDPHEVWLNRIKKPRDDAQAATHASRADATRVETIKESR